MGVLHPRNFQSVVLRESFAVCREKCHFPLKIHLFTKNLILGATEMSGNFIIKMFYFKGIG